MKVGLNLRGAKVLWQKTKQLQQYIVHEWRSFVKDDEARFRLLTSFKITSITLFSFFSLVVAMWMLLSMDLIFFRAQGYPGYTQFTEAFFDAISSKALDIIPHLFIVFIVILFFGLYVGQLLMRPFKIIGEYCEKKLSDENASYDPDFFSDLKVLTNFSEFFFSKVDEAKKIGVLKPVEIPEKFKKIHQPVFEKDFFIQFFLIILMISIGAGIYLYAIMTNVYEEMILLGNQVMPRTFEVRYFLTEQSAIWDNVLIIVLSLHLLLYFLLAFHLYSRVSGPAFGFFASMRSFLSGRTGARVHLIGYYYIRGHSRRFNKYLDKLENELVHKKK